MRKTLREQGPLPIADVLDLGIEILSALIAANEAGIIHRDIKPANIIVGSKKGPGRFAILDFGVAKIIDHEELLALEYSQKGHRRIMGSEGYMSPDQQRGNTDIYSDLFSLGATLYQAFTGKRPQKGTSSFTIIPGEVSEENLPTQTLTAFQEALNTMTGTNTNFRPSPAEMLSDLRQIKSRLDLRRRTLSTEPGSIPTIQPTTFTKVPEPSPTTKTRIESKPVITAREPEESQTIRVKADQPVAKVAAKPQAPAYSEDKTRDLRRGSDSAS
ncbi:hypothetical protein A2548_01495 [candidate division WOR-1 bacterium RIFOXYD2_FULL_41_8]|nr:MAG: hypothetical protein A2548_01495 [candidate division WOR-1 bacterium RIFOXYD2_FULL_41_8]